MTFNRRHILAMMGALPAQALATSAWANKDDVWSASRAFDALLQDRLRMLDIRTPEEWRETGVAQGAWPVNLYDERFPERLFKAQDLADGRPLALICRTGRRSGGVMNSLRKSGYSNFIDVSDGMLGSSYGPGWIKAGLPVVSAEEAIAALPPELRI
ncbi:rhodanese-like domain-containing protein [Aliiroseovarius sp. KMU-50]|uniref:Rhodanese-like domain-containing protein n=1 Tax=Aliiroseovarius salicola TaxID=3009082 RepID=A0ABT4W5H8_9RHOB|nr:rhodanese-like domain-containing protein [Aliiroseovarius sp. KMU-50]MDA5095784.1 rhodanese-like domain-containing protein [Aliiroseovarius sp. KMU-50]